MVLDINSPKMQQAQVNSDVFILFVQVLENLYTELSDSLEVLHAKPTINEKLAMRKLKEGTEQLNNFVKRQINPNIKNDYYNNSNMITGMFRLMLSKCGYDNDLLFYEFYKILEHYPTKNIYLSQNSVDRLINFEHLNDEDKKRIDDKINLLFRNHFIKS